MTALLVTVAGAAGVYLRYAISSAFHGDALPWATVGINVAGSLVLGYLVVAHWPTQELRTVLGVGFLGGFTTFSTFSVQAVLDTESRRAGSRRRVRAGERGARHRSRRRRLLDRARHPPLTGLE